MPGYMVHVKSCIAIQRSGYGRTHVSCAVCGKHRLSRVQLRTEDEGAVTVSNVCLHGCVKKFFNEDFGQDGSFSLRGSARIPRIDLIQSAGKVGEVKGSSKYDRPCVVCGASAKGGIWISVYEKIVVRRKVGEISEGFYTMCKDCLLSRINGRIDFLRVRGLFSYDDLPEWMRSDDGTDDKA